MKTELSRLAIGLVCLFYSHMASAASLSDAREVARMNNCSPKKVEVYRQSLGMDGQTIYKVECIMPKTKEESAGPSANAVLVSCDGMVCSLLRRITSGEK